MIEPDTPAYQVTLPVFEGPLDLLLHLIERQELDITKVSLAQVANQYLEHLAQIEERDPDRLADFLVVAAKLLLIKSRALLPQPAVPPEPEEGDVGDDLVRQLLEYRKFREVAHWLGTMEEEGLRSYVRLGGQPHVERTVDLGDVSLSDLLAAVREALAVKPPMPSVDRAVPPISITIEEQMQVIERKVSLGRPVSFYRLLQDATSRLEVIVTLLALLELVKQLRATMRQEQRFGDIWIETATPADPA